MIVLIFLVILALIPYLLQKPKVQNFIKDQATSYFSKRWDKDVEIANIHIDYPESVRLDSIFVSDKSEKDTLLFIGALNGNLNDFIYADKKIEFGALELNNVRLSAHRSSEGKLNFEKIISEFISSSDSDSTASSDPWDVSFESFASKDVSLKFKDDFNDSHYFVYYESYNILANEVDLLNSRLDIEKISSQGLNVDIVLSEDKEYDDDNASFELFPINWDVKINNAEIEDGDIRYARKDLVSDEYNGGIDWNDIHLLDFDLVLSEMKTSDKSIDAEIDRLDFIEKGGIEITKTHSSVSIGSRKMVFSDLLLKSKGSEVKNALTLKYKSISDFADFIDKVRLDIDLVDSKIIYDDLAYFAPGLNDLPLKKIQKDETVNISGRFKGKVKSLGGKDITVSLADGTRVMGSFSSQELTDPENTFLDFKLDEFKTTARSLRRLLPGVDLPDSFLKLGTMTFNGRYTGFYTDFVAYGTLNTALGEVSSDIKLTIDDKATYSGKLELKEFDIGAYLEQEESIGSLSLYANVNGKGLRLDDMLASIDGEVEKFNYRGYDYRDIKLDGTLEGRQFNGDFNIKDDNIAMDFQGKFDMRGDLPSYNFSTNLEHLDLNKLNILPEDYKISTKGRANMTGNDIDNFVGTAFFEDIVLTYEGQDYQLDSLQFESRIENDEKLIDLNSEIVDAHFNGKFSFRDIYFAVQNVVNEYISYRFLNSSKLTEGQYINFDINIKDPLSLTENLVPGLKELESGQIKGSIDSNTDQMEIDIDVPSLVYDDYSIRELKFDAYTENGKLLVDAQVEDIYNSDSLHIEKTTLKGNIQDDVLLFQLATSQDSSNNQLYVDGMATVDVDTINVAINESKLKLGTEEWNATSGDIRFVDVDYLLVSDLVLEKDSQTFVFNNSPLEKGKSISMLDADQVRLEDIISILGPNAPKLKGILDGQMEINDLLHLPQLTGDFDVKDLTYGEELLGNLSFVGIKNPNNDAVYVDGLLRGEDYQVQVMGDIAYEGSDVDMNLSAKASRFDLKVLEEIIGDFVYDTEGNATADLSIKGDFSDPDIDGTIYLEEGATTVGYLRTRYTADAQSIDVRDRRLFFKNFILTDIYENKAALNGDLSFKNLDEPTVYLDINTDRFLFLDTEEPDNEYFYGTAFASGDINFSGPFKKIEVTVLAQSEKGTVLNLPMSDSGSVEQESFFSFVNFSQDSLQIEDKKYEIDLSSWLMTFNMDITQDAQMNIIFDKSAGDIISANGDGNMRLEVNKFGDLNIFGDYTIAEGDYLFTMQNLINKKFTINPGSRIAWSGSPYLARLDVKAIYEKDLSPFDLISDQAESLTDSDVAIAKKRQTSRVNLNMTGILDKPDISMNLDMDKVEGGLVDLRVQNRLKEINNDPEKLNEQVFAVLILNQFVPYNNISSPFSGNSDLLVSSANTLSEFVSNQLSIYLTDAVSEVIPDLDINLNYQIYDTEDNIGSYRTNELELALGKRLLNDRLYVTLGGNLQLEKGGSTEATVSNQVLAGDFLIEYNITPDGTLKVKAYNQSDYDIIAKRVNKSGVGVTLRRQFRNYSEIFRRKKGRRPEGN